MRFVAKCVLYQNGKRFVWKRNAFCIKMKGVSIQIAFRIAINRAAFCHKTEVRTCQDALRETSSTISHRHCRDIVLKTPSNLCCFKTSYPELAYHIDSIKSKIKSKGYTLPINLSHYFQNLS